MTYRRSTLMMIGICGLLLMSIANRVHAEVFINEFNAVSGDEFLGESDAFFKNIAGNGGNWIELLVVGDGFGTTVDMRNFQINWGEDESGNELYEPNELGSITFANDDTWSSIQSGTIITIVETDNGGLTSTDTSFDGVDDFHINVSTLEEFGNVNPLITADTGENGVGDDGMFSVGNDDWFGQVFDGDGNVLFGPVGEAVEGWGGGGISGSETGRFEGGATGGLEAYQLDSIGDFDDSDNSTFGTANVFSGGTQIQNFMGLRTASVPEPGSMTFLSITATAMLIRRRRRV